MSNQNTPFRVAVVGGGLGGLSVAVGLLRRGIPVDVYEANPEFRETGLGLGIGPAAHRALPLIDEKLGEIYDAMVTTHETSTGNPDDRTIWFRATTGYGERSGNIFHTQRALPSGLTSVRRSDFLGALVNLIPKECTHLSKKLVDLKQHDDGVTMYFEDGTTAEADYVIGCDGIKSRVKTALFPDEPNKPAYSGMYGYRALIPMDVMEETIGDTARYATWHLAPGKYVIHYPIAHAKELNVGFYTLHEKWEGESWVREGSREDMENDFGQMTGAVAKILKLMPSPSQWAIFQNPPIKTYVKDSVAIIGDAAHATSPHMGAGAGQAIEDAYVLVEMLADPRLKERRHVQAALRAYDLVRRPRSQKVVQKSHENAKALCLMAPGIGTDEDKLRDLWTDNFHWLWDLDMKAHAESARSILTELLAKTSA